MPSSFASPCLHGLLRACCRAAMHRCPLRSARRAAARRTPGDVEQAEDRVYRIGQTRVGDSPPAPANCFCCLPCAACHCVCSLLPAARCLLPAAGCPLPAAAPACTHTPFCTSVSHEHERFLNGRRGQEVTCTWLQAFKVCTLVSPPYARLPFC